MGERDCASKILRTDLMIALKLHFLWNELLQPPGMNALYSIRIFVAVSTSDNNPDSIRFGTFKHYGIRSLSALIVLLRTLTSKQIIKFCGLAHAPCQKK